MSSRSGGSVSTKKSLTTIAHPFFRKRTPPFEPAVHWAFADDIDATHEELKSLGANIVEPLETMPWGMRQFTVEDLDGNRFYFHHD